MKTKEEKIAQLLIEINKIIADSEKSPQTPRSHPTPLLLTSSHSQLNKDFYMNDTNLTIEKMNLSQLIDTSTHYVMRNGIAAETKSSPPERRNRLIIINKFKTDNCTSFKTQKAGATLSTQEQPIISNIDEFEQFIKATGALYLLSAGSVARPVSNSMKWKRPRNFHHGQEKLPCARYSNI